ncbi:Glucosidase 2 subunit beta-like [Trypanosoma melophagium]|uniref:Glucosidase 2 subunit beta-like n=1 Tax=Trypanosoma melophagium TaxID=715481 RepID=UPI003519FD78|nr:Glucosidase 2 subunit beta-like [Trypanosoma melophagium]
MRRGSIITSTTTAAAVTLMVSVLLVCVTAEECEVARRVREHEVAVFKQLYTTMSAPNTRPSPSTTAPDGSISISNNNSGGSGTNSSSISSISAPPRRGCIGWQMRYWSYELCPGRWVRQYRQVRGVILEEFILGVHDRWHLMDELGAQPLLYENGHQTMPRRLRAAGTTVDTNTAAPYRCVQESKGAAINQVDVVYAAGSQCELGFQRSATLHLVCDKTAFIPHVQLREPFVCNYDITVVAAAICDAMDGRIQSPTELSDADMLFAL